MSQLRFTVKGGRHALRIQADRAPGARKQDKRARILAAARELFTRDGVSGVTTQQVGDRADVTVGTLYLYASTKAELLIMVQNARTDPCHSGAPPARGLSARFVRGRLRGLEQLTLMRSDADAGHLNLPPCVWRSGGVN